MSHRRGRSPYQPPAAPGRRRLIIGAGLLSLGGLTAWVATRPSGPGVPAGAIAAGAPAAGLRETRPTLPPERFVGRARLAHEVAREIPEVLDQLYCYCYCDRSIGHRSLLSCYTDGHAAT
jgi:hypothetical protein